MATTALTIDAAPTAKPPTYKITLKKSDKGSDLTWQQKRKVNMNFAVLKYETNIKLAVSAHRTGPEALQMLAAAHQPLVGASAPKSFISLNKKQKVNASHNHTKLKSDDDSSDSGFDDLFGQLGFDNPFGDIGSHSTNDDPFSNSDSGSTNDDPFGSSGSDDTSNDPFGSSGSDDTNDDPFGDSGSSGKAPTKSTGKGKNGKNPGKNSGSSGRNTTDSEDGGFGSNGKNSGSSGRNTTDSSEDGTGSNGKNPGKKSGSSGRNTTDSTDDGTGSNGKNPGKNSGSSNGFSNPLKDFGNDIGYHGEVQIGGQTFSVIFDTGSADLWIPAQDCRDSACQNHKSFDPKKSKGFVTHNKDWQIQYGTGSVSGIIGIDNVQVSGTGTKNQIFGLTTSMSEDFADAPFDGILGMALSQLSNQKAKTLFTLLVEQGAVKEPIFGFYLGRKDDNTEQNSQLTLGGIDSSLISGSPKFNKVINNVGFWEIAMDDATVNGKSLGFRSKTAIIDTGTSLLIAPPSDASKIHKAIDGSVEQQGQFFVPCDTKAVVSLTFGGVSYEISPKDLAREPISKRGLCISGIAGGTIGGDEQWLVGDTFLKNVYSVYDQKNLAVGFAPLKKGKQ
ncbi:hypothetical protein G9A89_006336 [Geosiphon pyriformis]|nr:hypothetical protein G9A89_006336 [Geosiphon pyriformis]